MKTLDVSYTGVATVEGDDPFCYGVHANILRDGNLVDFVDKIDDFFKDIKGAKVKICITISEVE
jgi:hypothetical protein